MKILIAYPNNIKKDNPFVRSLKQGLEEENCEVDWGLDEFWNYSDKYDIIHIHWPDSLFKDWSPTAQDVQLFKNHIQKLKTHAKIIYTRHNEIPHYYTNQNKLECYNIIEKNADAIVHLGNYGINEFKDKLNDENIKHFIIPHHIYENEYNTTLTKKEARNKLNIPQQKFVILSFGAYRDMEEVNMVLSEFKKLRNRQKYLLAPRLSKLLIEDAKNWYSYKWIKNKIRLLTLKAKNVYTGNDFISDEYLPYYFTAADVVLIQRKKILNSGNIPMAFLFSKLVVGANSGNIGELLIQTNNIVFNPNIEGDLCKALFAAEKISISAICEDNYNYAMQNLKASMSAAKYKKVYSTIFEGSH